MVRYADLPQYCHRNQISDSDIRKWLENIRRMKKIWIQPLIDNGEPTFDNSLPVDFQRVKNEIASDITCLVKYFLVCMKELRKEKHHPKARILVSLFMGQQSYEQDDILQKYQDGVDYGHLKMLQDIYFHWYHGQERQFYFNMMKILCEPYTDVMTDVVIMCEGLFKKAETSEFSQLIGDAADDYLGSEL